MSPRSEHSAIHAVRPAAAAAHGSARVLYLDGWRGLAILAVLLGHFGGAYWTPAYALGGFGVDLFFVLSGRLMADILFVSRQPLPTFFRRRFARILPALLVFVAATAAMAAAVYLLRGRNPVMPWEYVGALTLTMNYAQALGDRISPKLSHIWSLSVEEHCYILLALIAVVLARRADRAGWVLLAIGLLALLNGLRLYAAGVGDVHAVYWRTDVRLAPAFLSAATFLILRSADGIRARWAARLGLLPVPLVVATGLLFFLAPTPVAYTASALLLALAVNTLEFAPFDVRRGLSSRVLTTFGLLSYSLYLWQQPFYNLSMKLSGLVLLPMVAVAGVASYLLVERPARRWLNALGTRRVREPAIPVALEG